MILDSLTFAATYYPLHKRLEAGFSFLQSQDLNNLPVGNYEIDGKNIFAIVSEKQGKQTEEAKLEAHRSYIDIQYLVAGEEYIGWSPYADCKEVSSPFNPEKDIEFFADTPQTYCKLLPGHFGVFFPQDAHAPMVSEGVVRKVVVKVKIEL